MPRNSCGECKHYDHDPITDRPNPMLMKTYENGIRRSGHCLHPEAFIALVSLADWCERFKKAKTPVV